MMDQLIINDDEEGEKKKKKKKKTRLHMSEGWQAFTGEGNTGFMITAVFGCLGLLVQGFTVVVYHDQIVLGSSAAGLLGVVGLVIGLSYYKVDRFAVFKSMLPGVFLAFGLLGMMLGGLGLAGFLTKFEWATQSVLGGVLVGSLVLVALGLVILGKLKLVGGNALLAVAVRWRVVLRWVFSWRV